jgi:hypothetical protein
MKDGYRIVRAKIAPKKEERAIYTLPLKYKVEHVGVHNDPA